MAGIPKTVRSVMMTRDSAAQVLSDLADGLKKGDVSLAGRSGAVRLTPGAELKVRMATRGGVAKGEKGVLLVKLSWERALARKPGRAATEAAPATGQTPSRTSRRGRAR